MFLTVKEVIYFCAFEIPSSGILSTIMMIKLITWNEYRALKKIHKIRAGKRAKCRGTRRNVGEQVI